jgi:hypothetical protein
MKIGRLKWEDPSIMVTTVMRQLMERGKAEGLAEGRAKGLAEGQVKGLTVALIRVSERRFGPLPPDAKSRIAEADCSTLENWLDRAVTADTLDEVFAPAPFH